MSDAMHRPDHGGVAGHDDSDDEGRDPHRADGRPAPRDATDDGLRVIRRQDPQPAPRSRPGSDHMATRRVDDGWTPPPPDDRPWPLAEDRRWDAPQGHGPEVGQPRWDAPQGHGPEVGQPRWDAPQGRPWADDDVHARLDELPPPVVRDDGRPPPRAAGPAPPHPRDHDDVGSRPVADEPRRRDGEDFGPPAAAREGAPSADPGVDQPAPPADAEGHAPPPHHEIEESVPASVRLRAAAAQVAARVRRSVPLRTALFVLPPLLLPPALGLPLGASLVATLLLLWLAGAAALLATIMFDGSDQLALRSIDRRLQALEASVGAPAQADAPGGAAPVTAGRPAGDTEDALLAIGGQLDRLNDRLDELAAPRPHFSRPDDHRPAEQWSGQPEVGKDVGDALDRGPRQWSDEGWQGRMR